MQTLRDSFHFKLGNFKCFVIRDGTLTGQSTQPKISVNQHDSQLGQTMDVLCLFVRTEEHSVLIDSGFGFGEKPIVGKILQTNVGKMLQTLQNEGIKCSEIDTVILSHAHPDHIGGITDKKSRPVFPSARHIMYKKEWNFWMSDPDLSRIDEDLKQATLVAINKNLIPIQDRFDLLEGEIEIVKGIKLIKSPGHTPGSIILLVSSGNEQLICIFDLMHSPLEFTQPDLFKGDDMLSEQASATRNEILPRIVTSNTLVFASHFPFPGLGYILQKGDGYFWRPSTIAAFKKPRYSHKMGVIISL